MTDSDAIPEHDSEQEETSLSTKRVFLHVHNGDPIDVDEVVSKAPDRKFPKEFEVIHRQETYFGPKFTVEHPDGGEQYNLTVAGPNSEAILWQQSGFDWVEVAELTVSVGEDLPQQKICLHCGEPIKTSQHRTESFLGTCNRGEPADD